MAHHVRMPTVLFLSSAVVLTSEADNVNLRREAVPAPTSFALSEWEVLAVHAPGQPCAPGTHMPGRALLDANRDAFCHLLGPTTVALGDNAWVLSGACHTTVLSGSIDMVICSKPSPEACRSEGADGWIAYSCSNFIEGVAYTERVINNEDLGVVLYGAEGALQYCKDWCVSQVGCVGLFYQEHSYGHETCGLYFEEGTFDKPALNFAAHSGHRSGVVLQRDRASVPCMTAPPLDGWVVSDCSFIKGVRFNRTVVHESVVGVCVARCKAQCFGNKACVGFFLQKYVDRCECGFYAEAMTFADPHMVDGVSGVLVQKLPPLPHPQSTSDVKWCTAHADCARYGDTGAICTAHLCVCSPGFANPVNGALQETVHICVGAGRRADTHIRLSWDVPCELMTPVVQKAVSGALGSAVDGTVQSMQVVCNGKTHLTAAVAGVDVVHLATGDAEAAVVTELLRSSVAVAAGFVAPTAVGSSVVDNLRCRAEGARELLYLDGQCLAVNCTEGYVLSHATCTVDASSPADATGIVLVSVSAVLLIVALVALFVCCREKYTQQLRKKTAAELMLPEWKEQSGDPKRVSSASCEQNPVV